MKSDQTTIENKIQTSKQLNSNQISNINKNKLKRDKTRFKKTQ
jgi:hypothetical protein